MKEFIRKVLLAICVCIFLFSSYHLFMIFKEYYDIDQNNQMIKEEVTTIEKEKFQVDFNALKQINDEVIGWLNIEGTDISYPILQHDNNEYYLHHNLQKEDSRAGAIFIDCLNGQDFNDFNTIIYGHNMKNGSMFGQLKKYRNSTYYQEHPYIDIYQVDGVQKRYQIFSAGQIDVETTKTYLINTVNPKEKQEFIEEAKNRTPYPIDVDVSEDDKIITLSTCVPSGNEKYRYVVNAKLVETILE